MCCVGPDVISSCRWVASEDPRMSSHHLFGVLNTAASPYVCISPKPRRWPLLVIAGLGAVSVLALLGSLPRSDNARAIEARRVYGHSQAKEDVVRPPAVAERYQDHSKPTLVPVASYGSLPSNESHHARTEMALASVPANSSTIPPATHIMIEPATSAQSQQNLRSSTAKSSPAHRNATRKSTRRERPNTWGLYYGTGPYTYGYWGYGGNRNPSRFN